MDEFAIFSAAWLTEDPNAPWKPTDPNLIDNWDSRCDLDTDYDVDLVDFGILMYDWLWEACWRSASRGTWMMMGMGGGDMAKMMEVQSRTIADRRLSELAALRESEPEPEPTIEEQLDNAREIIKWLEEIWLDEETQKALGEEPWKEFMDIIYEWLYELEVIYDDMLSK